MLIPMGAESFSEALRMGSETYQWLRDVLKEKYGQDACNVGDEGGFAPDIESAEEGMDLLKTAIQKAGYTGKIFIGMDVAASEFFGQVVKLICNKKMCICFDMQTHAFHPCSDLRVNAA